MDYHSIIPKKGKKKGVYLVCSSEHDTCLGRISGWHFIFWSNTCRPEKEKRMEYLSELKPQLAISMNLNGANTACQIQLCRARV